MTGPPVFEEMKAALERAEKAISDQHDKIQALEGDLANIRYHFNIAVTALGKVAEILKRHQ